MLYNFFIIVLYYALLKTNNKSTQPIKLETTLFSTVPRFVKTCRIHTRVNLDVQSASSVHVVHTPAR